MNVSNNNQEKAESILTTRTYLCPDFTENETSQKKKKKKKEEEEL